MAEKRWSDYWGRYKSNQIPQRNYEKPREIKPKAEKRDRSTITLSPPKIPKLTNGGSGVKLNFQIVILVLLVLGVMGLGFLQSKSAKTIDVLFGERTDLECKLGNCTEELEATNTSLISCATNLGTCNKDLSKKISDLNGCENAKGNINQDYSNCKDDLLQYKRDFNNLDDDYDDCKTNLNNRAKDLDECRDDYNDLKNNYKNLCNEHCSEDCNFDSGSQKYRCEESSTSTTTSTIVATTQQTTTTTV